MKIKNSQLDYLLKFFNVQKPWDVIWVHRANDLKRFSKYSTSPDIMMMEGDILLSKDGKEVIMAHPLETASDLTFEKWFSTLIENKKGAKLDFKTPHAIIPAFEIMQSIKDISIPIFINADIIRGPGGKISLFETEKFISLSKKYFPKTTLSIGWTTAASEGKFTSEMIKQGIEAASEWEGHVTFAIRSSLIIKSWKAIKNIFDNPNYTITIWNSSNHWDEIFDSGELVKWMKDNIDEDKTFYDIIDFEENPIRF